MITEMILVAWFNRSSFESRKILAPSFPNVR